MDIDIKNGRNYIGCDISEKYVEIAKKRITKTFALNGFDSKVGMEAYEEDE